MYRLRPTKLTWPLYLEICFCLAAVVLSLLYLHGVLRIVSFAGGVLSFGCLLYFHRQIMHIEQAIQSSDILTPGQLQLSFGMRFHIIMDEISIRKRHEVSSALAKTQSEIDALQSQINPHFLYNTLDSIRGQALIDHSPVIAEMTEALSILFRYSISRQGNMVTLGEEIRCVKKYLIIQQFRFAGKFNFAEDIDASLLNCLIPRLTLQPIVENAIFHGLETCEKNGVLRLKVFQNGSYFVVRISDNGTGMSAIQLSSINEKLRENTLSVAPPTAPKGSGIALGNINRRIRLAFGDQYGLVLSSVPGSGTDVEIILPPIIHGQESEFS